MDSLRHAREAIWAPLQDPALSPRLYGRGPHVGTAGCAWLEPDGGASDAAAARGLRDAGSGWCPARRLASVVAGRVRDGAAIVIGVDVLVRGRLGCSPLGQAAGTRRRRPGRCMAGAPQGWLGWS